MRFSLWRSRWAAIGAAVAVALGAGGLGLAGAVVPPAPNPVTTLITPCRLMDTRAGATNVGPRATPLGAGETYTALVWGTNGQCTIPATATGIVANVTIVGPTASSFLTVWPADKARPTASNLNWSAGQAPVANQVTSALSADGHLSIFNLGGTVNVIVDITGYLSPADLSNYYTKAQVDTAVAAAAACKGFPHRYVSWAGCDVSYANFGAAMFANAVLTTANFHGAELTGANFYTANLSGADFSLVNLPNADLASANLTGTNLSNSILTSANLTNATLTGANLTGATLTSVLWSNTTCPDGTNSNSDGGTCIGHL